MLGKRSAFVKGNPGRPFVSLPTNSSPPSIGSQETIEIVHPTNYQYSMQGDGLPDDLDLAGTIQIPRFGAGQRIFRRYTLQKIIGRGGMGVVWLAQDAYLETPVALKVLPDTLLHDSASLDSLKRETKLGL